MGYNLFNTRHNGDKTFLMAIAIFIVSAFVFFFALPNNNELNNNTEQYLLSKIDSENYLSAYDVDGVTCITYQCGDIKTSKDVKNVEVVYTEEKPILVIEYPVRHYYFGDIARYHNDKYIFYIPEGTFENNSAFNVRVIKN